MTQPIAITHDDLLRVLTEAIGRDEEIPEEFEPFVRKFLPPVTAASAKWLRHKQPQGAFGPLEGRGIINEAMGSHEGRTFVDPSITERPGGEVTTEIPNAYEGDLDRHEPRMPPKDTWWKT